MSMPGGYLALLSMFAAGAFAKARNDRKVRLQEATYYPTPAPDPGLDNGSGAGSPQPPTGLECGSWQPVIMPPHGTVGFWVDDGAGGCKLQCKEGWTVTDDGKGCVQVLDPAGPPQATPAPPPLIPGGLTPLEGPSGAGTCVEGFYSQTPQKVAPQLLAELDTPTGELAQGMWFHIQPGLQQTLFNEIRSRFMSANRSLPSVVVRDALESALGDCDFYAPMTGAQELVYESGLLLAKLAMSQTGWVPNQGGTGHILMKTPGTNTGPALVARDWLGLTSDNAQSIQPGQRVELLAGEYTMGDITGGLSLGFPYAENIIARVTSVDPQSQTFEVQVIDQFLGADRTPKLSANHHYNSGTNIKLKMNAPTGLRRIYPAGVT